MRCEPYRADIELSVRTMQIVVGAMAGILILTGGAFVALSVTSVRPIMNSNRLTLMAGAIAVGLLALRSVIVRAQFKAAEQRLRNEPLPSALAERDPVSFDIPRLLALYRQTLIISAALVEGPTLFLLVAFFLERSWLALGVAALMWLRLAAMIPRTPAVMQWIENQTRELESARAIKTL